MLGSSRRLLQIVSRENIWNKPPSSPSDPLRAIHNQRSSLRNPLPLQTQRVNSSDASSLALESQPSKPLTVAPYRESFRSATFPDPSTNSVNSESGYLDVLPDEDIIALAYHVCTFSEILSSLRNTFVECEDNFDKDPLKVKAHERLHDLLLVIKGVLNKYQPLHSTDILAAAGTLVSKVKSHNYEDTSRAPGGFYESVDQLALAFSTSVSDFLMGKQGISVSEFAMSKKSSRSLDDYGDSSEKNKETEERSSKPHHPQVPPEILARGPSALDAYNKAIADGKTSDKRVPIMLTGQDGTGKTSLKKSLKGICFDPEEDSTVGIDVDPSHFKVTIETRKTGMTGTNQNSDAGSSFDYYTARCIVATLKEDKKGTLPDTVADETASTVNSEITEMLTKPIPADPSRAAEHIQTSSDPAPILSKDENHVHLLPKPTESNQEDVVHSTPHVPEEIAIVTEMLLQGDLEDNEEDVYSTLWDFAGQSVYYVTHPLFLTPRAIYLLVCDLSLNPHDRAKPQVKQGVYKKFQGNFDQKTNLHYLDFWMTSVASLARSHDDQVDAISKLWVLPEKLPPVFLVCTHADTPFGDRDPSELAYEIFGCLKSKPYGAHLFDVFVVDNTKSGTESECSEVVRLRQKILAVAKELPNLNEAIPLKWLKFEKAVNALKNKGLKYISLETAKAIASKVCNINEEKELETLMNYLHDLRSLVHFDDSPELKKLVVLDPQWLVDVFKKVITVQPAFHCTEKRFLELWCKLEREGILDGKLLAHVWEPLFDNKETIESLIGIMEKFSLLCPWPSDTSETKSYLVPSMLRSHPPKEIIDLVESANIPSLFLKFENCQVPLSLFPRLILQFFQWGKGTLWSPVNPQLFHNFARFFATGNEGWSVILLCHSSSIEVVFHTRNLSLEMVEDLFSKLAVPGDFHCGVAGATCPYAVRRQLELILDCMRSEFCWLRNIRYQMSVLCPVCSRGRATNYCLSHYVQRCKEEQCLHFLAVSEICSAKQPLFCTRSASAQNTEVQVMQFAPWFDLQGQQIEIGKREERHPLAEVNEEQALALPVGVVESLKSQSWESKQIVSQLKETLQLDQASLEHPDPNTKKVIRCLARTAKCSNRLDVVKDMREITPAGTTGPLLPEHLHVRRIPFRQGRDLTVALSGGDEWKVVAEVLGFNADQIRFLDNRTCNPAEAILGYITDERCLTVGDLYDVLNDCGLPVIADKL